MKAGGKLGLRTNQKISQWLWDCIRTHMLYAKRGIDVGMVFGPFPSDSTDVYHQIAPIRVFLVYSWLVRVSKVCSRNQSNFL